MREDYKIQGPVSKLSVEVQADVVEMLKAMEEHTSINISELTNTALRRFITAHKDYLPSHYVKPRDRVK